jgi:hypothetical protein
MLVGTCPRRGPERPAPPKGAFAAYPPKDSKRRRKPGVAALALLEDLVLPIYTVEDSTIGMREQVRNNTEARIKTQLNHEKPATTAIQGRMHSPQDRHQVH